MASRLFGTIALLPLLTQRLMGYPAMSAGMLFIPRAIASAIALAITGNYLMNWIDARILVAAGIVLSAVGTIMMAGLSLLSRRLGHRLAGRHRRHWHGSVLRAADRGRLRQNGE